MTAQGYMPVAKTIEWGTPRYIFDSLNQEFNFTLDVCAADGMEVLPNYFNPADNGLAQDWGDNIAYMNPPYGRTLPQWVEKAIQHKGTVVALLPAKTDTRYFKRIFETAQEIRFIEGRVKYRGASVPAPFGSMIAVWREGGGMTGSLSVSLVKYDVPKGASE